MKAKRSRTKGNPQEGNATTSVAYALKAQVGSKVRYRSADETVGGTVTEVRQDGFTILWDDGLSCSARFDNHKCLVHLDDIEFL